MNNYGKEGLKEGEENNGGRKGEVEGVVGLQNWYLKCKQQSICELYVRYEFVSVMHAAIETFPFHIYSKEPLKNLKREAQ